MAHFAKIDTNNIVTTVEVISNKVLKNSEGVEEEINGLNFLINFYNEPSAVWKQTSYNTYGGIHYSFDADNNRIESADQTKAFRKNYAGIGHTYDESKDAFIPPAPSDLPSWVLNETTCNWEAPVAKPETVLPNNQIYIWNEETVSWDIQTIEQSVIDGSIQLTEQYPEGNKSYKEIHETE
jgi:hypothetical protein